MHTRWKITLFVAGALVPGCSPKGSDVQDATVGGADDGDGDGDDDGDGDGDGDGGGTDAGGADADADGDGGTAGDADDDSGGGDESTGGEDDGGSTGAIFIIPSDGGVGTFECDPWAQDCAEGQKCQPWANDGGGAWNATRCVEIDANPGQPGDECSVEGTGVSGIDDCDLGVVCWDVDPETNLGTCVPMCQGDEDNPICEDPDTVCTIANGGVLILCLPTCDPLIQDCPEGQACYPIADDFACAPDVSGEQGAAGDPCEFINVCDAGGFCLDAAALTSCDGSGCCVPACDVTDPGADAACVAFDAGTTCESWYEDGQAPPGYESVGVCVVPE